MALPIVVLPNDERWDCHQCGACCRSSLVHLTDQDVERIRSQNWAERPGFRNTRILIRCGVMSTRYRLAQKADGSCVFLDDGGLCRIHSEFGVANKPEVCRAFPLQLVPRAGKAVLTVRRSCPSSAEDKGLPIKHYLASVQQRVRDGSIANTSIAPPALKPGEHREWKVVGHALDKVSALLQDDRFPPVRRLVHTLQFAHLLSKARTKSMDDNKVIELLDTLATLAPDESKTLFNERRPPAAFASILFRSMGLEYARLHPMVRVEKNWSLRLRMVGNLFRLTRSNGALPSALPVFPAARLTELDQPLGQLPLKIDHPLSRFIETSAASFLYAINDRKGWSVVDSIRGLAATFPIGLWLLRWTAQGREPTVQDMIQIVVAIDRGNGFAPLVGSLQRTRLRLLSSDSQLERLVIWHAR